jgi:hypothetical protein
MERKRLGLSPELRTPPTGAGRRTSGWGQAIEHGPETTLYVIDLASNPACSLVMCDLASHATMQKPTHPGHGQLLVVARIVESEEGDWREPGRFA